MHNPSGGYVLPGIYRQWGIGSSPPSWGSAPLGWHRPCALSPVLASGSHLFSRGICYAVIGSYPHAGDQYLDRVPTIERHIEPQK